MVIMNTARGVLKSIVRHSGNLKQYNTIVIRSLACQVHFEVTKNTLQTQQFKFKRNYGEWAPNVVKSHIKDIALPNDLFTDYLWAKNERWENSTAIVCGITGREITYAKLRQLCKKFATSLLKEGFKPGQVIAIVLPNIPEFAVIVFGILDAGLVVTTINPLYTADEIAYQLKDSSSVAIIGLPNKLNDILEAKNILSKEDEEAASKLRVICSPDINGNETDIPAGIERYSKYVSDSVDESALPSLQTRNRSQNDVIFIPYSSGTTGRPKGVCLTQSNLLGHLIQMFESKHLEETSNGRQEVLPFLLPGFHIYGFSVILSQALFHGAKLVTLPKFEESSFLRVIKDYKATILYVAPPLVIYLGTSPKVTKEHLKSLKMIMSGAAPCADTDILKCVKKSPSTIIYMQGYGLTETSPAVCTTPIDITNYSSVGKPLVNTLVKVSDLQTGQALGPNEEGEICIKGPQVMKGYLNNEKANAEVFDSEGWFHTGDVGYYDNEKCFYITDRVKELIKVKGFQVAPAELEAVLRSHDEIEDAGVIGVPDPLKGETPIAFVTPKTGSTVSVDDLKGFLSKKLAKYKQVDIFIFVDSIPKSSAGKILRKQLRSNYLESLKK